MKKYIALLRGINVGTGSSLPMDDLRKIFEMLGARDVQTYIQSGNVIFQHDENEIQNLVGQLGREIQKKFGFAPKAILMTPVELEDAIAKNPFQEAEVNASSLHLGFLSRPTEEINMEKLEAFKTASERFHLTPRVFYLYAPQGVGKSKLAGNVEKILGVDMTDRNWKTVLKIREIVNETRE